MWGKEFYSSVIVIAFLVSVILFFIEGVMPVVVVWSLVFMLWAMNKTEPKLTNNKMTTWGLRSTDKLYSFEEMNQFWFETKWSTRLLRINLSQSPWHEVKKVAQKGLKSKFERDLELQNDIEYYQDVLSGKIKTTFILGQKVSATESLPIQIVLLIQKTINDLRIELSKRLGEYATTQVELSNKNFIPDEVVITIIDGKRVD